MPYAGAGKHVAMWQPLVSFREATPTKQYVERRVAVKMKE